MPDDISIPPSQMGALPQGAPRTSFTPSYRARRAGMDTGTKRLFLAAAGLGALLLGGMGVWSLGGHRAAGVPVIEADTRPLRVKPENPGGMTVLGANEQIMGGHGDGDAGDLAPPPERPDPQALRAQRQVAAAPPKPDAPAAAAPVAPSPDPAAAPRAAAPATKPPAAAALPTGGPMVQIAATDSQAGATAEWQRLARKSPELLGDKQPSIVKADHDGKTVWRVRTGGFADMAAATEFCRKARAKGLGCNVASS